LQKNQKQKKRAEKTKNSKAGTEVEEFQVRVCWGIGHKNLAIKQ